MGVRLGTKTDEKAIKLIAHSGKNGISAYEVAVENGFVGTEEEWLKSLRGEKGDRGSDLKASVIIASGKSGAEEDACDFLYAEGDDFAQIFSSASGMAKSMGIGKIEILDGVYMAKSTVIMDVPEVIGIGNVEILPYNGEGQKDMTVRFNCEKIFLENIKFGKSGAEFSAMERECDEVYMNRVELMGGFSAISAKVHIENSKIAETLRIMNAKSSRVVNCDIDSINAGTGTKDCHITGCRIGEIVSLPKENILRNNTIGGKIQQPFVSERFMNVSFGRITTQSVYDTVVRDIEGDSFEIYINEGRDMTVEIYTGTSSLPAKTLTSDVFMFISGNQGDDVVDGDRYQKTLILYLNSELGVETLGRYIAFSGSDVYSNVRIEITCPPNTYRGVMKNKSGAIYCEDREV